MEISLPTLKINKTNDNISYVSFLSIKDVFSLLVYQDESFKELKNSKTLKISKNISEDFINISISIVNLILEGKNNFSADSLEENIGKLNIDLSSKLFFVEYEQLLQIKKNPELNEDEKIILIITPVNDLGLYKNYTSESFQAKDKYYDLINNNIITCDFDSLIEKERTSISHNSLKLLTLSSIKSVNERLILNTKENEKENLVISFWKMVFEKLDFINIKKPYEIRENYIITSAMVLYTIAEVIVKPDLNEINYSQRLDSLKEIQWDKKNYIWNQIQLIDNEGNIQLDSKDKFEHYLTEFFKNKFNLKQKLYSSEEIYIVLRKKIESEYSTKWELNYRVDGNASLKNTDGKVFLYFTHELGGVTINARIYPDNPKIQKYTDIWQTSRRINKVGRWGEEIIDIRLNNFSDIDRYFELINIISKR